MGPSLHKTPTWDKNTELAERQTNTERQLRKTKKSDHSKLANIFSLFKVPRHCLPYSKVFFVPRDCFMQRAHWTHYLLLWSAVLYQPIREVCKSCIVSQVRTEGKIEIQTLSSKGNKIGFSKQMKVIKVWQVCVLSKLQHCAIAHFFRKCRTIISTRPGAKGHEEGMITCTYVYIRIPNVHFLLI